MKRFLEASILSVLSLCLCASVVLGQTSVPSVLAFPAGPVGVPETTQATVFTNTTASTLASLTVTVGGTNSGDFSASTNPSTSCGGSLTAGSTCTVTVTFTPGAVGARSATLTYSWTGGSLVVNMNGTGLATAAITMPETTAPTGSSNNDLIWADSADHIPHFNANNAGNQNFPQTVFLTSTYTNATTIFSNVTGLSFVAAANRNYRMNCVITWQGSATTTGPKYQFTGPAGATAVTVGMLSIVTPTTEIAAFTGAFSTAVANTGTITTATNFTDHVDLGLVNGTTAGTVQLQAAANGAGTLTIQPGSYCSIQ